MAGIVNENIVFPVLDLIKRELDKYHSQVGSMGNPLEGEPSVLLHRNHLLDEDVVTGADLTYESGWVVEIYMKYGLEDMELPYGIGFDHVDYSFYKNFCLSQVTVSTVSNEGVSVVTYHIRLNYDEKGRLTGTSVNRI